MILEEKSNRLRWDYEITMRWNETRKNVAQADFFDFMNKKYVNDSIHTCLALFYRLVRAITFKVFSTELNRLYNSLFVALQ